MQSVRNSIPRKNHLCALRLAPVAESIIEWKITFLAGRTPLNLSRGKLSGKLPFNSNDSQEFYGERDNGKIFARRRRNWQGFGLFMSVVQSVDEQGGCKEHLRRNLAARICARHCYRFFRSFQTVLGLGKRVWMCVSRKLQAVVHGKRKKAFCTGFMRKVLIFPFFSFAFILVTEIRREAQLKDDLRHLLPFPHDFRFRFSQTLISTGNRGMSEYFLRLRSRKNMKAKVLSTKSIFEQSLRLLWHGKHKFDEARRATWLTLDSCQRSV